MNFVGIDIHKKYSVLTAKNRKGQTLGTFRVSGNSRSGFSEVFKGLGGKSTVVIEACWNWGKIYDTLESLSEVREVVVAHPSKTRLIADAQIKTDKVDSAALADLLRGNLIPRIHVPNPAARARKDRLRQRLYWARLRTKIRNRVHALLDRQDDLQLPQCSDIFGVRGMGYLRQLNLPEPDQSLLQDDLALLDLLREQIKAQEKQIQVENEADEATVLIESIPGMGKILAAVVASEIDDIERFPSAEKLTNILDGRLLKPPGSQSVVHPTLQSSADSSGSEARTRTPQSPSWLGGCAGSSGSCSAKSGTFTTRKEDEA